jgi:transcriptional regulator with XRE-family HTH domain
MGVRMDTFRDMLDDLCRDRGIQYAELARAVGVTKSYIGQLVHGHSKPPPRERCLQIAEVLELSPAERERLVTLAICERASDEARQFIESLSADVATLRAAGAGSAPTGGVPVAGTVSAGQTNVTFTDEGLPTGEAAPGEEPIARWPGLGEHAFALRISDDSMRPLAPPGARVVIDPDRTPRNGEPGVCLAVDGQSYFRLIQFEASGSVRLASTSEAVGDLVLARNEVHRLQKAVALLYT